MKNKLLNELQKAGIGVIKISDNLDLTLTNPEQAAAAEVIKANIKYIRPLWYVEKRVSMYPPIGDQLDYSYKITKRMRESNLTDWDGAPNYEALIDAVKAVPKNYGDKLLKVKAGQNFQGNENAIVVYTITALDATTINYSYKVYDSDAFDNETANYSGSVIVQDTADTVQIGQEEDYNLTIQNKILTYEGFDVFEAYQVL